MFHSGGLTSFDITVAKPLLCGDDSLELATNILNLSNLLNQIKVRVYEFILELVMA